MSCEPSLVNGFCSAWLCLCCREWVEDTQLWIQQVSSTPSTRMDVVHLQEQLDLKLQQRQARETGICPVRRELYSQCFGEWPGGGGYTTLYCLLPFPFNTGPSPEYPQAEAHLILESAVSFYLPHLGTAKHTFFLSWPRLSYVCPHLSVNLVPDNLVPHLLADVWSK